MFKKILFKLPEFFIKPIEFIYNNIPKDYKKSRKYKEVYKNTIFELNLVENMKDADLIKSFKFNKLKNLLIYCNDNVEYYRKLFEKIRFNPNDMKSIEEINKIPLLDKKIIRDNYEKLISDKYKPINDKLIKMSTGGSTGEPLEFLVDKDFFEAREDAFIDYIFEKASYCSDYKTIILRGDIVRNIEKKIKKNVYWRKKSGTNELIMSSYHLNDGTYKFYIEQLIKYSPECIKAYPSSLELLAKNLKKFNCKIKGVKLIILASENLNPNQYKLFKEVFENSTIFSFYGHTEHCCLATLEKNGIDYKFLNSYGYTEFENNGYEINEIICTGYNNYVMPFIRYKTGDLIEKIINNENSIIVRNIKGREKEYIIDKNGREIVFTGSYKILNCVKEKIILGQIIQEKKGELLINIIPQIDFNDEDINLINTAFKNKYGSKINVEVNKVNSLERTNRGKINFFIQKIK